MISLNNFTYPFEIQSDINGSEYASRVNQLISYYTDRFMRTIVGKSVWNAMQADWDGTQFATEKYENLFFGDSNNFEGIKPALLPYLFYNIIKELPTVYADGGMMQTQKENLKYLNNTEILLRATNETMNRIGGEDYTVRIDYGTSIYDYLQANKADFETLKFNYLAI